jgi:hypothetical protein
MVTLLTLTRYLGVLSFYCPILKVALPAAHDCRLPIKLFVFKRLVKYKLKEALLNLSKRGVGVVVACWIPVSHEKEIPIGRQFKSGTPQIPISKITLM